MESKNVPTIEQIEKKLLGWEKWLYACFGMAVIMLIHAFTKAYENQLAADAFFILEKEAGVALPFPTQLKVSFSSWRPLLWLVVELAILFSAAVLAYHPTWRKISIHKRLDLIFGYLLAGWINLLSLGAQDPLDPFDVLGYYNILVVVYMLALGLGYWRLRRKKEKAEEVFP